MYKLIKILHLLGLTLFLGSIFGHIVESGLGGEIGSAGFLAAREAISAATRALTLPGLGLAIATGLALALMSKVKRGWMAAHGGLALAVAVITAVFVVPAGNRAESAAEAIARGEAVPADAGAALVIERAAGTVSVILTIAIVSLGVIKPALTRRLRRDGPALARRDPAST